MGKDYVPTGNPVGRPSDYDPSYAEQAYKLCLLGATDKELSDFFSISEQTLNNWKGKFPEFIESIKRGKDIADASVAEKLFQRALGYSHPAVKIMSYEGTVITEDYTEHYPPDTGAAMAWLKNRQPGKWRDRQDVALSGTLNIVGAILEDIDGRSKDLPTDTSDQG